MKETYDFTHAIKNPYAKRLKKQLTIRLDTETIAYFQELSREMGLPYQSLINLYLRDCARSRRRLQWSSLPAAAGRKTFGASSGPDVRKRRTASEASS